MDVEYDRQGRRRVTLWKHAELDDIPVTSERTTPMTATATVSRPLTEAEVQAKESEWAPLLSQMHDDLERMRRDPDMPQHAVTRHEKAYGELHAAYVGLRDPETALRLERRDAPEPGTETLLRKCEQLQKADATLSAAEQFRQAMRDPEIQRLYFEQSGTARPAPATDRRLAKP